MKKKIFIAGGVGLVVILAILFFLQGEDASVGPSPVENLPFGSGEGVSQPGDGLTVDEENELIFDDAGIPRTNLFRISDNPTAGALPITRGGQTIARYVERATGHIVEVILPQGEELAAVERRKITNTTMPKIYEAYFRADGGAVLLRSLRSDLDAQNNTSLTLSAPTGTSTDGLYGISAAAFRGDMGSVAVQGNNLFYSLKDSKTIVSSTFNSESPRNLMTSEFTEWIIKPAGANLIIYTKASQGVLGYAYLLNTTNGSLTKLLGPLEALVVTPNQAGTRLAYSYKEGGLTVAETKNLQNGAVLTLIPATLADKCVWDSTQVAILYCGVPLHRAGIGEPDNWYAGVSSFTDRIWMFDTNTEIAQMISAPEITQNLSLDVYRPNISPLGDYLIFMNKRDLSLWALKLE